MIIINLLLNLKGVLITLLKCVISRGIFIGEH